MADSTKVSSETAASGTDGPGTDGPGTTGWRTPGSRQDVPATPARGNPAQEHPAAEPPGTSETKIRVEGLAFGYGGDPVQHDVSFEVHEKSIFAIMGGSGSGKSTLMKTMVGLLRPKAGRVLVGEEDYWRATEARRVEIGRRFGVVFQSGALWSSMTAEENVALPLRMFTGLDEATILALARLKLSLVGLDTAGSVMPAALSGGMRRRVGIARALALDPEVLFLDEPSAGLDPISSRRLDDLILELRDGFGMTVIVVSHELPSLFGICDDGVFLDAVSKTPVAHGSPAELRDASDVPIVHAFMNRERLDGEHPQKGNDDG